MAKTLNEIYTEIISNEEKKAKFASLKTIDEVTAFVSELGGDASADEIRAFIKDKKNAELTDDDLEQVAGGKEYSSSLTANCTDY